MPSAIKINKQGQALGRKGGETRRRLLDATLALIGEEGSHKLSASRIARSAGVASQSFYLYFRDIDEILLTLSEEASADFKDVVQVVESAPADIAPHRLSRMLIEAFSEYWGRHRAILNVRNYLADCGNAEFLKLRFLTTIPLIDSLAKRILAAQAPGSLTRSDARGRAVIIYQAMERSAARETAVQYSDGEFPLDLRGAAIDVLTLLLLPAPDLSPGKPAATH